MRFLVSDIDAEPRARPQPITLRGRYVTLEPASTLHRGALWACQADADQTAIAHSFTYMSYGPFASSSIFDSWFTGFAARDDQVVWAICPGAGGPAGWLALMDIQPQHGTVELGNIWLSSPLRRGRAATEAFFLVLGYAAETLLYRRLCWKCNSLNTASRQAALRLGFTYEGILRNHMIVKDRSRDTAYFSILDDEWPYVAHGLRNWLDPDNFDPDGRQRLSLAQIRASLAAASPNS